MQVYTSPLYPSLHDQTYGYRGMSQSPYPGQHKKTDEWMWHHGVSWKFPGLASRALHVVLGRSLPTKMVPRWIRIWSKNYGKNLLNLTLDGAVSIVMETTHQRNWRTTAFSDYCPQWWAVAGCMRVRSTRCSPATAMKILTRHFPR